VELEREVFELTTETYTEPFLVVRPTPKGAGRGGGVSKARGSTDHKALETLVSQDA
jgi:hypothetical protein